MNSETQARTYFIFGSILLLALIIGGIIWAIVAGPQSTNGGQEVGLSFSDDNDPAKGPADAKVTVRVFGDFQCPACRAAEEGVKHAMQTYGDKVRFVWSDFPLVTVHKNALPAANAARCAEEQGKFWEFHDKVYEAQDEWSDLSSPSAKFQEYAKGLGLREDAFAACVAANRYQWKIQDDLDEGQSNAIDATPTFFVNNTRLVGVRSNVDWDQAIQGQLQGK